ncbi:MAG: DUF3887 domain-containing protein [Planctomycetes bacterium]|nr:DUF3887 domain-containing protein [Planctomycetota bacterium]
MLRVISIVTILGFSFDQDDEKFNPAETAKKFLEDLLNGQEEDAYNLCADHLKTPDAKEKFSGFIKKVNEQLGKLVEIVNLEEQKFNLKESNFRVILHCRFERFLADFIIYFDKKNMIHGFETANPDMDRFHKIPAYADKDKFFEDEVAVGEVSEGNYLTGYLTYPDPEKLKDTKMTGPYPILILVSGAGPYDYDHSVGPNKMFKDIAYGLSSKGIAVLRYSNRLRSDPKIQGKYTIKELYTDDAVNAVKTIVSKSAQILEEDNIQLDTKRIFILGHAHAGSMIPKIAEAVSGSGLKDADVRGYIIMSGIAQPLEDTTLKEISARFNEDGKMDDTESALYTELSKKVANAKSKDLNDKFASDQLPFDIPAVFWLSLQGYNPTEAAASMNKPLLLLHAQRDVLAEKDFATWKKHLSNSTYTLVKPYETLNRFFIAGQGKIVEAEFGIPGNVSEEVIKDIAEWILK